MTASCPVCVDLSARIASALNALTWDLPHDNRVETARRCLRGQS